MEDVRLHVHIFSEILDLCTSSVGRADDVIVLSSGEKLVPIPAEDLINKSPLVAMSMLFGREQSSVGVIVEPRKPILAGDETAAAAFRESIMYVLLEHRERLDLTGCPCKVCH